MSETPPPGAEAGVKEETPNQKQARLRRERRQAKIQNEGASRLETIAGVSGRRAPPMDPPSQSSTPNRPSTPSVPAPSVTSVDHPDPEEVDISQHYYAPQTTRRPIQSSSLQPWQQDIGGRSSPMPGPGRPPGGPNPQLPEDPMMRMMQQMLGVNPNQPGVDPKTGLPPGFAEMMGQAGEGQGLQGQEASSTAYIWRIVHALVSFSLAMYVVLTSTFTGSRALRSPIQVPGRELDDRDHFAQRLFVYFATVEVVLQSSRYFMEKGQLKQSGLMGTLSQLLPEPYAGYIRIVGRYSVIYNTVVADAMVVIFVLGTVAWWHGVVEA